MDSAPDHPMRSEVLEGCILDLDTTIGMALLELKLLQMSFRQISPSELEVLICVLVLHTFSLGLVFEIVVQEVSWFTLQ